MILNKLFSPYAQDSGTKDPASWLVDWFRGGVDSESGVTVNQKTAMTSGPFYQAVAILSGDLAQLPLRVMERKPNGDTERDRLHMGGRLFSVQPNIEMTPSTIKRLMQSWAFLWGNAVAAIERQGSVPVGLIPLLPDRTWVERGPDGQLWYLTRSESTNTEVRFRPEDVLHIQSDSQNGVWGRSKVDLARGTVALDLSLRKHGNALFRNGARPSGVVQRPIQDGAALSKPARDEFRREWNEIYGGVDNAGKIALLQEGMTFNAMSISNIDAEWIAAQRLSPEQIARFFKIPPYRLGAMQDSSVRANLEQQHRDYLTSTLNEILITWEEECNKKLLTAHQRRTGSHFFKWNVDSLLRADIKTRYDAYLVGRIGGWLSPNKVLELEDMKRREDEGGDSYDNPNTSAPTDQPGSAADVPPEPGRRSAAHRELIADRVRQMLVVERNKVLRAAKRGGNFLEWVDEFYDGYGGLADEYLKPSIMAAASAGIGVDLLRAMAASTIHAENQRSQLIELTGVATPDTLHELVKGQKPPSTDALVDAIFSKEQIHAAA